jgi:hypothetical protein
MRKFLYIIFAVLFVIDILALICTMGTYDVYVGLAARFEEKFILK